MTFPKLGPPISDQVVGNHFMAKKSCHAGQTIAENGAADMPDMHRLGDVR